MKEKEQENVKDIKEKVRGIHYSAFDKLLRVKVMLKCLETACCYDHDLDAKDIQLYVEVLSQKTAEMETYIDELSVV